MNLVALAECDATARLISENTVHCTWESLVHIGTLLILAFMCLSPVNIRDGKVRNTVI